MSLFCAASAKHFIAAMLLLWLLMAATLEITGAQSIGVCYGGRYGSANNLPPETEAIDLCKTNGIGRMRIYDPNQMVLQALKGSNIELIIGVANSNIQAIASDASAATQWVQNNVQNFLSDVKFRYIAVGNEVQPADAEAQYVLPAMKNIYSAVSSANLQDQIKVSTVIDLRLLGNTYPPSQGSFSDIATPYINPIIGFLANTGSLVLADVYPYFTYIYNTQDINLSYALFTSPGPVVHDNGLEYQNLFDALMDALYSAVEKAGGTNLEIAVTESGWPSQGGTAATLENAGTYYKNLINHVKGSMGTPKKPGKTIETYLFELFDENLKNGDESERHFGLFYADKQPKYGQINFT